MNTILSTIKFMIIALVFNQANASAHLDRNVLPLFKSIPKGYTFNKCFGITSNKRKLDKIVKENKHLCLINKNELYEYKVISAKEVGAYREEVGFNVSTNKNTVEKIDFENNQYLIIGKVKSLNDEEINFLFGDSNEDINLESINLADLETEGKKVKEALSKTDS